jgi:chemotaxis protein MotB
MNPRALLIVLLMLSFGVGCVPQAKYDTALSDGASLSRQVADLEAELVTVRAALADTEAALASETEKGAHLSELVSSLEARAAELTSSLDSLSGTVEALQTRGRKDDQKKAELEQLLASLRDTSAQTAAEVEAARTRIAELDTERARLTAEADALRAEKAALAEKTEEYDLLVSALESEIDAGEIKITELSGRLTVNVSNAILFDSGKYTLKSAGTEALGKVAQVLAQVGDRTIAVEGHTDDDAVRAGAAYADNWALASLRASTVVSLLVSEGVDPLGIRAVGLGEFRPVASNEDDQGKAANRRTEIVLLPKLD